MNASELRIGNWVKSKINLNEFQVDAERISSAYYSPEYHEPIPLYGQWIKRINGIIKQGLWHYLPLSNGSELWFQKGNVYIAGPDCPNINYATETAIEAVHQLQNLYQAIEGKELTFNPQANG